MMSLSQTFNELDPYWITPIIMLMLLPFGSQLATEVASTGIAPPFASSSSSSSSASSPDESVKASSLHAHAMTHHAQPTAVLIPLLTGGMGAATSFGGNSPLGGGAFR